MNTFEVLKDKELIKKIICRFNSFEDMTFEEICYYTDPDYAEKDNKVTYLVDIETRPGFQIFFSIIKDNQEALLGKYVYFSNESDQDLSVIFELPDEDTLDLYKKEIKDGDNPWSYLGFEEKDLKSLPKGKPIEDYVDLVEMIRFKSIEYIAEQFKQALFTFDTKISVEVEFSIGFFTTIVKESNVLRIAPYAYQKKPYRFYELLPLTYFFNS
jgi:hypothetical protein